MSPIDALGEGFKVRRVREGNYSSPEPPFDPSWSLLTQLRWHAALAVLDAGSDVKVRITAGYSARKPWWSRVWITDDDVFQIQVGRQGWSPMGFDAAWTFINGIGAGLRAATSITREDKP